MTETVTTPECNGVASSNTRNSELDGVSSHSCEDESGSELFDSFMEIANDPSHREHQGEAKPEPSRMTEKLESEGTEEECNQDGQFEKLSLGSEDRVVNGRCEQAVCPVTKLETEEKSEGGNRPRTEDSEKRESNVRLSKAVGDLDGLQQQLSSMMVSLQSQASNETEEKNTDTMGSLKPGVDSAKNDPEQTVTQDLTPAKNGAHSGDQNLDENLERVSRAVGEEQGSTSEVESGNQDDDEKQGALPPTQGEENVPGNSSHGCEESGDVHQVKVEEVQQEKSHMDEADTQLSAESTTPTMKEDNDYNSPDDPELCTGDGQSNNDNKTPQTSLSAEISGPRCDVLGDSSSTGDLASMPVSCEVTPPLNSTVPDIEIATVDGQCSSSEVKSLDSLDMDQSSGSQPGSPSQSDEGIDSDTRSDCEDEPSFLDPESLQRSRPKSWYLEIASRDSIHSDSSAEGDSRAGGKSSKASSLGEVLIRGHLLKMGGSGFRPKNWRKRWFVLKKDNCLYYYKHSKDTHSLGVIVLANYSISKAVEISKRFCFRLNKGGARTYYLCAADESDMRKWMMTLNSALKDAAAVGNNSFQISESNVHNVSIPALSIRDPDCHGYLSKLGQGKVKTWKRRYCVLKNGYLYYYTDMSNATALGVAKLLGYVLRNGDQQGKRFCFNALPPEDSQRTYFFAAESEGERRRWMRRLEFSIKKGGGAAEAE